MSAVFTVFHSDRIRNLIFGGQIARVKEWVVPGMQYQAGYPDVLQESDAAAAIVVVPVTVEPMKRSGYIFIELDEISAIQGSLKIDKSFYLVALCSDPAKHFSHQESLVSSGEALVDS